MQEPTTESTPQPPRRKRSGCFWGAIVLLVLSAFALFVAIIAAVAMKSSFDVPVKLHRMGVDEYPDFEEVWAYGSGDTKVVCIPLQGIIMMGDDGGGFFSSISSTEMALLSIRRATNDEDVRAIILRVDSGGGGITASDIIYKALLDFKEKEPERCVVAVFGDVAASGAYYVSLAADSIVAHPTTITGSIGVLIQSLNAVELGQKIGIKDITIKSGKNKDILNPLGDFTEEQRLLLQGLVDELHSRFVRLVSEGRGIPLDAVRTLADGRIYSASQALDMGLVDQIGYWEDGMEKTASILGVDSVRVYRYEQGFSISSMFKSARNWNPVDSLLYRAKQPRLLYLWTL